jgi:hypothetical protein
MQPSNIKSHGNTKSHKLNVEKLKIGDDSLEEPGVVSGISADVPRIERFLAALELVKTSAAYDQFPSLVASRIDVSLPSGKYYKDDSPEVARQLVLSMAEPLRAVDRSVFRRAVSSSVGIDKTMDTLLMLGRTLVPEGIYDFLVGIEGGAGAEVGDAFTAMENIMKRACSMPATRDGPSKFLQETWLFILRGEGGGWGSPYWKLGRGGGAKLAKWMNETLKSCETAVLRHITIGGNNFHRGRGLLSREQARG